MKLANLSEKQKRVADLSRYIKTDVASAELRSRMIEALKEYRTLIAKCWEDNAIDEEDCLKFADLERQLRALEEEARVTVIGREDLSNQHS